MQALGEPVGELERDRAPDGLADQVRLVDAEMLHEMDEIRRESLQRPGIAGRGNRGSPEASSIDADDPVISGEQRDPAVPELRALGVAVMQDDGFCRRPRIGEIVVVVVHEQIAGKPRCRHRSVLLIDAESSAAASPTQPIWETSGSGNRWGVSGGSGETPFLPTN